jgi:hypothetical protein
MARNKYFRETEKAPLPIDEEPKKVEPITRELPVIEAPVERPILKSEKEIEDVVPVVVTPPAAIPQPVVQKQKEIKRLSFNGFYKFEDNYKKIAQFLNSGWKIVSEVKTTTSHKIVLER